MIKLLVISGLAVAGLAGQAPSICSLVTAADATAILGVSAKQTRDPGGCGWEDATHKMTLNVAYVNVPTMFEAARAGSARKGKVQDEKDLGGPAFSTSADAAKGGRVALYCLKQSTVLILDLESAGAVDRLPQMRDVMRKLVPKP
jgi:hypothetical protein